MAVLFEDLIRIAFVGIGATAVMDVWLLLLQRIKVQTLHLGLVGRWVGHMFRGKWAHNAIASAAPVEGERMLGWLTHYAVGVALAGLLVALCGVALDEKPEVPAGPLLRGNRHGRGAAVRHAAGHGSRLRRFKDVDARPELPAITGQPRRIRERHVPLRRAPRVDCGMTAC